jgi:LmbE family N-acetylglucosaminyl deacetylase
MDRLIYLSPHLDDAVLSCGALIHDQVRSGKYAVEVWTVCSGDPPPGKLFPFASLLHQRWKTGAEGPAARREEDTIACRRLGCIPVHLDFPDCIYRTVSGTDQPRIKKNEDLFHFDPAADNFFIEELSSIFMREIPEGCRLVAPLGVGGHIDHLVTRTAAEALGRPLEYYADFPYSGIHPEEVKRKTHNMMKPTRYPASSNALQAWQTAVSAYGSQISSFWPSIEKMKFALEQYAASPIGNCLWSKVDFPPTN